VRMDARNWQVWFKLLSPYNEALAVLLASAALTRDNFPNIVLRVKQSRKTNTKEKTNKKRVLTEGYTFLNTL
jgi:hypothetical protein